MQAQLFEMGHCTNNTCMFARSNRSSDRCVVATGHLHRVIVVILLCMKQKIICVGRLVVRSRVLSLFGVGFRVDWMWFEPITMGQIR